MTPDELDEQLRRQRRIAVTKKMLENIVARNTALRFAMMQLPYYRQEVITDCGEFRLRMIADDLRAL